MTSHNITLEHIKSARMPRVCTTAHVPFYYFSVKELPGIDELPFAYVCLIENILRNAETDSDALMGVQSVYEAAYEGTFNEISFMPARVLFQDFTGVPVFVDFATMRDALAAQGKDPLLINPQIPCTLVVDHSIIAEDAEDSCACHNNEQREVQQNAERFAFLKWAAQAFEHVEIVPPGEGICHQLNIERFSEVVTFDALQQRDLPVACFDTLIGTDSHTTTANGLGILGWGVGGIEAEAAALGQPISLLVPPVVGLHFTGTLQPGVSGMDVALAVAELLRREGVVGCIVEVGGEGVATLSATQRSCIANMTPEYGATATLFAVDEQTLTFLVQTNRDEALITRIRTYFELQSLFSQRSARYARTLTLDLSSLGASLAGPSRPHERLALSELKECVEKRAQEHAVTRALLPVSDATSDEKFSDGTLALAAITSCTTATDPRMMLAAGLLARKARAYGLRPQPWVKLVFAPGSKAVVALLEKTGLLEDLEALGFYVCGFGCMSCIGNSGEIKPCLKPWADRIDLTSVLSGNRNFEGRISPDVSQNYLCQPALVVAYSLVGSMSVDLSNTPVGTSDGHPVWLADIMPSETELDELICRVLTPALYAESQKTLKEGSSAWKTIPFQNQPTFAWDESSTYVRKAPYFDETHVLSEIRLTDAALLAHFGDFITTDHISPAGSIAPTSPAAHYLEERGFERARFNTYGSRRGNHEVMMRGTFANVKLENLLVAPERGNLTLDPLTQERITFFEAASRARERNQDLVIIAGKMYGSGSSRDWAGKGPALLGVKAVIAESFERIHRSNLVQMGVIPLQIVDPEQLPDDMLNAQTRVSLRISLEDPTLAGKVVDVHIQNGARFVRLPCVVRLDTEKEIAFVRAGGILPYVVAQKS